MTRAQVHLAKMLALVSAGAVCFLVYFLVANGWVR